MFDRFTVHFRLNTKSLCNNLLNVLESILMWLVIINFACVAAVIVKLLPFLLQLMLNAVIEYIILTGMSQIF